MIYKKQIFLFSILSLLSVKHVQAGMFKDAAKGIYDYTVDTVRYFLKENPNYQFNFDRLDSDHTKLSSVNVHFIYTPSRKSWKLDPVIAPLCKSKVTVQKSIYTVPQQYSTPKYLSNKTLDPRCEYRLNYVLVEVEQNEILHRLRNNYSKDFFYKNFKESAVQKQVFYYKLGGSSTDGATDIKIKCSFSEDTKTGKTIQKCNKQENKYKVLNQLTTNIELSIQGIEALNI